MFIEGCGYYGCQCGVKFQVLVEAKTEEGYPLLDEEGNQIYLTDWDKSADLMYKHVNKCVLNAPQAQAEASLIQDLADTLNNVANNQ